jgi:hypothetical protein
LRGAKINPRSCGERSGEDAPPVRQVGSIFKKIGSRYPFDTIDLFETPPKVIHRHTPSVDSLKKLGLAENLTSADFFYCSPDPFRSEEQKDDGDS